MDPITTAFVTALTALEAGAASGLTEASKAAISDAYHALKDLLVRKSGAKSDVAQAISHLEAKPDSRGRQETLQEEITATAFSQDPEVLATAQYVLALVQPQQVGQGKFTIQNNAHVQGQNIGDHNAINQQFGEVYKHSGKDINTPVSDSKEVGKHRIENNAPVQGQNIGDHNTTNVINKTAVKMRQHPLTAGIVTVVILVLLLGVTKIVPALMSRTQALGPSASPGPTSKPLHVVGTWSGCMMAGFNEAEFHNDGTAYLDSHVEKYTFDSTQVEFSNTPYNIGAVEYSALLSSSSNVLTLSDTQGHFCVMARSGSTQELLSSIIGTWIGDCNEYIDSEPVEFHQIAFLADGAFTSDGTLPVEEKSFNGTYTIPATEMSIPDDYSILGLLSGNGYRTPFDWKISANGKTLALDELGGYSCSLMRS